MTRTGRTRDDFRVGADLPSCRSLHRRRSATGRIAAALFTTVDCSAERPDQWSQYWPAAENDDFAKFINPIRKYVLSTTLEDADWTGTTILRSLDELRELHLVYRPVQQG